MPRTSYDKRRHATPGRGGGGGGGGLSRLLGNILAGGETATANETADPELSEFMGTEGGFVDRKGNFVSQPFEDRRGFFAKAAGAPNLAQELNTEIQAQKFLQDILSPGRLQEAEQTALIQALGGILRSDTEGVSAFRGRRVAEQGAGQKKAEAEGEEATSRAMIERETRTPRRRIAQQAAQRGVAESTRQALAAMSGEGQQAIEGRYLAEQLAPIFNLRKAATISVSPGEVSQFSGERLPDQLQKLFGPGFTARGTTYNEQPILGQPIGKSGLRAFLGMGRNMQPGGVYPNFTAEEVQQFLGQGQQLPDTSSVIAPPQPRSMPGRGSGGLSMDARSVLPLEMIQAQPEEGSLLEWLKRQLSGPMMGGFR